MKNIKYLVSVCAGLLMLSGCASDKDSNPVMKNPATFTMNAPAYAQNVYNLSSTDSITFTAKQPDYGFTAATSYVLEMSVTGEFADKTDVSDATYTKLTGVLVSPKASVSAADLDYAIQSLSGWQGASECPTTPISIVLKMIAYPSYDASKVISSNTVTLRVLPYYQDLSVAAPEPPYLVGACIGSESWSNSATSVGTGLVPFFTVKGESYDAKTGAGKFVYTGWFPKGEGFKIVKTPGDWNSQWGNGGGDGIDNIVKDDGGSGNFSVPADGFYTIYCNTATGECTIEAATVTETIYNSMFTTGDFCSWGAEAMSPVCTLDNNEAHNHIWKFTIDAGDNGTTFKFRESNANWDISWGGSDFPAGIATKNGSNIPVSGGKYTVFFNDVDGSYIFLAQ